MISILLCQHDGENTCGDSLVAWIWRMHVQIEVVAINLPEYRLALISNRAEVMLPIWVIVGVKASNSCTCRNSRIHIP